MALAIHTHHDDLLGAVAPLAIASARSTVLVVDLDPDGLALPGERTLADLVEDGPTLTELVPQRAGIASSPQRRSGRFDGRGGRRSVGEGLAGPDRSDEAFRSEGCRW